ncbi:MAG: hypothetical protein ACPGSG_04385 [Prolixibacteraceae bacterium]|jgi:hypothetical protein|nr:hypothetical protein [Prolixibacteraceae bacterium]
MNYKKLIYFVIALCAVYYVALYFGGNTFLSKMKEYAYSESVNPSQPLNDSQKIMESQKDEDFDDPYFIPQSYKTPSSDTEMQAMYFTKIFMVSKMLLLQDYFDLTLAQQNLINDVVLNIYYPKNRTFLIESSTVKEYDLKSINQALIDSTKFLQMVDSICTSHHIALWKLKRDDDYSIKRVDSLASLVNLSERMKSHLLYITRERNKLIDQAGCNNSVDFIRAVSEYTYQFNSSFSFNEIKVVKAKLLKQKSFLTATKAMDTKPKPNATIESAMFMTYYNFFFELNAIQYYYSGKENNTIRINKSKELIDSFRKNFGVKFNI